MVTDPFYTFFWKKGFTKMILGFYKKIVVGTDNYRYFCIAKFIMDISIF